MKWDGMERDEVGWKEKGGDGVGRDRQRCTGVGELGYVCMYVWYDHIIGFRKKSGYNGSYAMR